ncbi:3-phosphoshikimate 1-carboxyvinyltransferase [Coriobacteriia bacterium Es71-Z0120]|uniref:3-phosphoshikimate 1-carboxyvinyltransferase n=1 Tax=Parvivirga hydrogeniphila TaxID=2939460 RepID=UPI002260E95D|nr:3-phosphoshikimate 1-carboxyvinyltransferase [Parvivirga hydrogeniphila]MCL4079054.1 3-phosphoshikimate 1-carboxyvinyltransferase [Parvivirga hydrogeniphila]
MDVTIEPAGAPLRGSIRVPSDKSISHRAVLFAAMAEGTSVLCDVLDAYDVRSTISAVSALGAGVATRPGADGLDVVVQGWGARGPHAPAGPIDCGNSGTTARLLMGVLAGYPLAVRLVGDASLSRRPMRRVTDPLERMGARFCVSGSGTLPIEVHGGDLVGCDHTLGVASAQVKSALLLAGLHARGVTRVTEPAPSRDHTERLLPAFGADLVRESSTCVRLSGPQDLVATDVPVPADPSSAAFLIVAALLVPGSEVVFRDVCLNPTRTGFFEVLRRMGADITVVRSRRSGGEDVGDVAVRHSGALRGTTVVPEEVPSLIDEVPVLAVAATAAEGATRFCSVGELRVKESDRFDAIVGGLQAMGARAYADGDDLVVEGPARLQGASVSSRGDHRLAMAFAVAGLAAQEPVRIRAFEAVEISYPRFLDDLARLAAG